MRLPYYSWAQGLLVAVHSLALAYDNDTNCPSMTLERAAEKLDSLRRAHKLNSVLSFATFDGRFGTHGGVWVAAVCDRRSLHQEQDYCGYGRLRLPCLLNHLSKKSTVPS